MREIVRFDVLGLKCVPWSMPNIGMSTSKCGTPRRYARKDASLTAWQSEVANQARIAMGAAPVFLGPVLIDFTFLRETPPGKCHGDRWDVAVESSNHGYVKPGSPQPDLDNLSKGTADALEGIVLGNDVQTSEFHARRHYGPQDGVRVVVYALELGDVASIEPAADVPLRLVA